MRYRKIISAEILLLIFIFTFFITTSQVFHSDVIKNDFETSDSKMKDHQQKPDISWVTYPGLNCYAGRGADMTLEPFTLENVSLEQCKAPCESEPYCHGYIHGQEGKCHWIKNIEVEKCELAHINTANLYMKLKAPLTCSRYDSRYVFWDVSLGREENKSCQDGHAGDEGMAFWKCGQDGNFLTNQPDRSRCKWGTMDDINDKFSDENATSTDISQMVLEFVADLAGSGASIGGATLKNLTFELIPDLLSRHRNETDHGFDKDLRPSLKFNFTSSIYEIIDVLVNDTISWLDFSLDNERFDLSTSLLISSEDTAFLFLKNNTDTFNQTWSHVNVLLQVISTEDRFCSSLDEIIYCLANPDLLEDLLGESSFSIYSAVFSLLSQNVKYFPSKSYTNYNWHFDTSSKQTAKGYLQKVFGLTLNNRSLTTKFDDFSPENEIVSITFNHRRINEEDERTVCVSLDIETSQWTTKGCWLKESSNTQSTCSCNHLTNFGLMFDNWDVKQDSVLDLLNNIFGTISCICLLLTIGLILRKRERDILHEMELNRTCCLLAFMTTFLVLTPQDKNLSSLIPKLRGSSSIQHDTSWMLPYICQAFGSIIHLTWLATFFWTGLESFYFYKILVTILRGFEMKRVHLYLIAYGIPLLLVALVIGGEAVFCVIIKYFHVDTTQMDCQFYRKATYWNINGDEAVLSPGWCWMNRYSIWVAVIPVGIILIGNFLMTVRIVSISYKAGARAQIPNPTRQAFRNFMMMSILLGLTWLLFPMVYIKVPGSQYLFVILNSACGICHLMYQVISKMEYNIKARKKRDSSTHLYDMDDKYE